MVDAIENGSQWMKKLYVGAGVTAALIAVLLTALPTILHAGVYTLFMRANRCVAGQTGIDRHDQPQCAGSARETEARRLRDG